MGGETPGLYQGGFLGFQEHSLLLPTDLLLVFSIIPLCNQLIFFFSILSEHPVFVTKFLLEVTDMAMFLFGVSVSKTICNG